MAIEEADGIRIAVFLRNINYVEAQEIVQKYMT